MKTLSLWGSFLLVTNYTENFQCLLVFYVKVELNKWNYIKEIDFFVD